jgi:cytochrome c556
MNKVLTSLALATAAVSFVAPASAQFAKPEDAIKYRKASFTVMAAHFSRVAAMANGRIPFDAKAVADNAAVAENMSKLPWAAFGEGTGQGNTNAKPEIWTEAAKFSEGRDKMQAEMSKLALAAKTGNQDAIKAAVGATGATCKGCHDQFKKE